MRTEERTRVIDLRDGVDAGAKFDFSSEIRTPRLKSQGWDIAALYSLQYDRLPIPENQTGATSALQISYYHTQFI